MASIPSISAVSTSIANSTRSRREAQLLEQTAPGRVLAGQRLNDPGQLRPVQVEQRTRDQLRDPSATGWDRGLALHQRPFVHRLHQMHRTVGEQGPSKPVT